MAVNVLEPSWRGSIPTPMFLHFRGSTVILQSATYFRYVSVLVELTRVEGTKHGQLIAEQMLDVAVRVQSVRHFAISQMALLIENAHLLYRSSMCEVLYAAAWICGEYAE